MRFKNIILSIAIMVLTIAVVVYGVNAVYAEPQYDEFCPQSNVPYNYDDKGSRICPSVCIEMYEIKNGSCVFNECGSGCGADGITSFESSELCEMGLDGKNCYGLYDDAYQEHSRNKFFIALPLGILIIALGAIAFGLESVGAGLMAGGVGVLLWGVGGFWRYADNTLKFVMSLAGLVLVIWLTYYFNKKFAKSGRKR